MSELRKFLFQDMPVRGMLVRLDSDWQEVLKRREHAIDWPLPVQSLLGKMAAASVLMQSNIKFNGALIFQIFGDGALKLAVAECNADLTFRVTAKTQGDIAPEATLQSIANAHGEGRCAITLDPQDKMPGQQPYQGVVALEVDGTPNASIAQVLEQYMLLSEQLETKIILASNGEVAAGLFIQRIPGMGENNVGGTQQLDARAVRKETEDEDFTRISILASSLKDEELLTLGGDEILRRLFWQEDVEILETRTPTFACSCSRERVTSMVHSLGEQEAKDIIAERGKIDVNCDFCGAHYGFDSVEISAIFAPLDKQAPGSQALQ